MLCYYVFLFLVSDCTQSNTTQLDSPCKCGSTASCGKGFYCYVSSLCEDRPKGIHNPFAFLGEHFFYLFIFIPFFSSNFPFYKKLSLQQIAKDVRLFIQKYLCTS